MERERLEDLSPPSTRSSLKESPRVANHDAQEEGEVDNAPAPWQPSETVRVARERDGSGGAQRGERYEITWSVDGHLRQSRLKRNVQQEAHDDTFGPSQSASLHGQIVKLRLRMDSIL